MSADDDHVYEFDMTKHALVIAFPYAEEVGCGHEFIGPPVFLSNQPDDEDPHDQLEAALLFALQFVRERAIQPVKSYDYDSPGDIPGMEEHK